jgi:hypothetical protein
MIDAEMNRREFTQLWSLLLILITGAKAPAESTDNKSFWQDRIADNIPEHWRYIEKALADQWEYENRPGAHNHEDGLLAALMDGTWRKEDPPELREGPITARERKIVATVIQWLGTNCGRSFIYEATARMGERCYPFQPAIDAFEKSDRNDRKRLWEELMKREGKHAWLPVK